MMEKRRFDERLDELCRRIAEAYADVPEEVGMAEIDAAVTADRRSEAQEAKSPR